MDNVPSRVGLGIKVGEWILDNKKDDRICKRETENKKVRREREVYRGGKDWGQRHEWYDIGERSVD